jgi:hypothetical protein
MVRMPQRSPDTNPARPPPPRRATPGGVLVLVFVFQHANFYKRTLSATQLRDLAAHFARALLSNPRPPIGGRRECRAPDAPDSRVCKGSGSQHTRCQVTPESPGIPRAMVLRLIRDLPGDRAFLPPSHADVAANLTPASGRQDHTTSPSASRIARQARSPRPSHPAPRFVTLRNAPPRSGTTTDIR